MNNFRPFTSDDLISILGLTIKRDAINKLATFFTALSAYTDSAQINTAFNAPSSAGKSYIPLEVAKLFPSEDVKLMGHCSPTSFFHDIGTLDKGKGGYVIDLSRKILIFMDQPNPMLLHFLRPLLSHDKREIEMKITDKSQKGGLRTKTIFLKGYPSVIFCTAGLNLDEQEKTRFILLSPEISQEKIRESIHQAIQKATNSKAFEQSLSQNQERNLLIERICAIKNAGIEDIRVSDPDGIESAFLKHKKILKPRHQRDIKRVIAFVKIFALLNLWWREREENDLTTNQEDAVEAFKLWDAIGKSQDLGIPPYTLQVYEEVILEAFQANGRRGLSRQNIADKHFQVYARPVASWQLRQDILPMLETAGLIRQEQHPNDRRQVLVYPVEQEAPSFADNSSEFGGGVFQGTNHLKTQKALYNDVINQLKPLEAFLDDGTIPLDHRKQRLDEHKELTARASKLKIGIESLGHQMTGDEMLNGFADGE